MSVASEIERLQNAKADLKTSINAKTDSSHQITDETIDDYADFVDSIQTGGGDIPEKGIELSDWDEDGYPQKAEIKGMTAIPDSYMATTIDGCYGKIKTITVPSGVTTIGDYAFQNNRQATSITLPNTITSIGQYAFRNCYEWNEPIVISASSISSQAFDSCKKLKSIKVTGSGLRLVSNTFKSCIALKKICCPNITGAFGGNGASPFQNCSSLKQIWLGDKIIGGYMERYSCYGSLVLEKIYINMPRATVETYPGYYYAFVNDVSKKEIIVCNDDQGFITEAQFDALDPDTM